MHSTKISLEFECQGQMSKAEVTGVKKTKKCGILFQSHPLGRDPRVAFFQEQYLGCAPLRRWENVRMLSSFVVIFSGF